MKENKFPNISDPKAPDVKVRKKKKRKKLLTTPSQIIRGFMVTFYIIAVLMLSFSFVSFTVFIDDDLEITNDPAKYYSKLASQEDVDNAAKELQSAIDSLVEKPREEKSSSEESSKTEESSSGSVLSFFESASAATSFMERHYNIASGIKAEELDRLINKGLNVKRYLYTEESVEKMENALLKAQWVLCTDLTVSQAPLQLALSGGGHFSNDVLNHILMYFIVLIPVVGFFIACFNRFGHLKNIYTLIGSFVSIAIIFRLFYPYFTYGAVFEIFIYLILAALAFAGLYAKQQEDFIILHPEKEAEFTEKHPQFVKALINEKTISMSLKKDDAPPKKEKKLKKRT